MCTRNNNKLNYIVYLSVPGPFCRYTYQVDYRGLLVPFLYINRNRTKTFLLCKSVAKTDFQSVLYRLNILTFRALALRQSE